MDLSRSISEPLRLLIDFHNQFNRNIKITFGALASLDGSASANAEVVALPSGPEPWGKTTRWSNLNPRLKDAASFVAELGLARAASAFEDYVNGACAELDRLSFRSASLEASTNVTRLIERLGIDGAIVADTTQMVDFFDVARNCVVHRSNRASPSLAELAQSAAFLGLLERWPRRISKWRVSIPDVQEGRIVEWRPRHAIMASDAYYRLAVALDRALIHQVGEAGLTNMAAYWCLLADRPAPCSAKINPETMVRSQLMSRYLARSVDLGEVVSHMRQTGKWDDVRAAYAKKHPPKQRAQRSSRR